MQQRETRTLVNNSSVQLQNDPDESAPKEYNILNISRGGLCFESDAHDFELNEVITFSIFINQQPIHKGHGRVCYSNESQTENNTAYGLSFLDAFIDSDIVHRLLHPESAQKK